MSKPDSPNDKKTLWEKIKFAFSLEPGWEMTPEDFELLDEVAEKIVKRDLTGPVILALQSALPLGFLGSQAMIALQPFMELVISAEKYEQFAQIMERREGVNLLIESIEKAEAKK